MRQNFSAKEITEENLQSVLETLSGDSLEDDDERMNNVFKLTRNSSIPV